MNALKHLLTFIWQHPLNQNGRLAAVARFARWQLASRLVTGPVRHPWINGTSIFLSRGESGVTQNLYCGLHEFVDMAFLLHVTDDSDLFVDIGANVGSYSVLACGARGAKGICFEPVPETFLRLKQNLAANFLNDSVLALNLALSDQVGQLEFSSSENCTNHALPDSERGRSDAISVPVERLDDVLRGKSATVMKIDVEGFETKVLRGASETLASSSLRAVIMELNGSGARYGFDEQAIVDVMRQAGFDTYSYDPWTRSLLELSGKCLDSGNTLFLREREWIVNKIAQAPAFRVLDQDL